MGWRPPQHDGVCYSEPGEGGDGAYFVDGGCWRKWTPTPAPGDSDDFEHLDGGTA